MKKLLFVNACVRNEKSRTKILADYLIEKLETRFQVKELNLMKEDLKVLTEERLNKRDELKIKNLDDSMFDYAKELADADLIIVAAPFWDLSFPAILKIYIENIFVEGITFTYGERGIKGLAKGENLVYITTRGGKYKGSPLEMGVSHFKGVCDMLGINNFYSIEGEGLDMGIDSLENILEELKKEINALVEKL